MVAPTLSLLLSPPNSWILIGFHITEEDHISDTHSKHLFILDTVRRVLFHIFNYSSSKFS